MVIKACITGLSIALRYPRILVFFYLANLVTGFVITVPLNSALRSTAGYSLLSDRLITGPDLNLVVELFQANLGLGASIAGLAVFLGGLYFLIGVFFSGGAFEVYRETEDRLGFWSGASRHFWVFFRILLWSIPFVVVIGVILLAVNLVKRLVIGSDPLQSVAFWAHLVVFGVAFLGVLFLTLIVDYARAHVVLAREKHAGKAVWRAFKFILRYPFRTCGFLILVLIISGLGALLIKWMGSLTGVITSGPAVGLFIISQAYIIMRLILRLTRYGGVLDLYEGSFSQDPPEIEIPVECCIEDEPLVFLES